MVPLPGSPAIDAGSNSLIPSGVSTDQRGLARIFNHTVDVGAVEFSQITITGTVYNDLNGNGSRQTGEPGMAGVQVYVDLQDKGVFVNGDPIATANSSGNYTLTFVPPAGSTSFIVREVRPNGWRRTQPAGLYPLGYYTISAANALDANLNFGNSQTSLVLGTVFHDLNANGKQDSGEAGLSGWSILVDQLVSGVWQNNKFSVVTDGKGNYSLVLAAGTYRIHEVAKGGLKPTIPVSGTVTLSVPAGATVTGENFGNK